MATVSRLFGERNKKQREEPSYVVTSKFDGSKSVDLDKFIQDEEIKEQIKSFAKKGKR